MKYSTSLPEEELKNKVAADFFGDFDATRILGNIDFSVSIPNDTSDIEDVYFLLWAESKKGDKSNVYNSLTQLILTIGKEEANYKYNAPSFLAAFDSQKIAFIPYNEIMGIFNQSDFNWNVAPSDYTTKEFKQVSESVKSILENNLLIFEFERDDKELKGFIRSNFKNNKKKISKIQINKNNFVSIYQKWRRDVMPSIEIDWEVMKKNGVLDHDFFLADLLSDHNKPIKETLHVLLENNHYILDRKITAAGLFAVSEAKFNDEQKAHTLFWNRYERPPKREYWDYIIDRKDLLVPQDIRERQGSFFTPQQWVELSQKYLEDTFGEDWQDKYYIWDCAAGTGNLLNGLTNTYQIWASTLNAGDVDVMKERIKNGASLVESHVFQFDFLNDDFSQVPEGLRNILNDPEERKKLIIYINPPYKEHSDAKQISKTGKNISGLAKETLIYKKYQPKIGEAARELFAQFLYRIYKELPGVKIANFSTLKNLQAPNFFKFRKEFNPKLKSLFLMPAKTFDNVTGKFPIGFMIWNTEEQSEFREIEAPVYDSKATLIGTKVVSSYIDNKYVIEWLKHFHDKKNSTVVGYLRMNGTDVQHNNHIFITNKLSNNDKKYCLFTPITINNIIPTSIYCVIRKVIEKTWLNDRDQYLYPNERFLNDLDFQLDCLMYAIFDNEITMDSDLKNHWIPFSEQEVKAKDSFKSHFLYDYIKGKIRPVGLSLFNPSFPNNIPLPFSKEAIAVLNAGRELWKYYHSHEKSDPNAGMNDIKLFFCGTFTTKNGKIKMNSTSSDIYYNELISKLKVSQKQLMDKILPKVYEYEFLKDSFTPVV